MLEFILKYWIQVAFGLIVSGLTVCLKKFWTMYKKEKERDREELRKTISEEIDTSFKKNHQEILDYYNKSQEDDEVLQKQINKLEDNLGILSRGILSIQGHQFKKNCQELLEESHIITEQEYENITTEHTTYKDLGGNHDGDALYKAVQKKYFSGFNNTQK